MLPLRLLACRFVTYNMMPHLLFMLHKPRFIKFSQLHDAILRPRIKVDEENIYAQACSYKFIVPLLIKLLSCWIRNFKLLLPIWLLRRLYACRQLQNWRASSHIPLPHFHTYGMPFSSRFFIRYFDKIIIWSSSRLFISRIAAAFFSPPTTHTALILLS